MASKREERFIYAVSSDGCLDLFPGNLANNFNILLKEPLVFPDDEDWEVGILELQYPLSWANITPASKMKYVSSLGSIGEIIFPRWQCEKLEDLINYIKAQVPHDIYDVGLDELGRFKMESKIMFSCDVGFTDDLREILGLDTADERLSYTSMTRRSFERLNMAEFWLAGVNPLDIHRKTINDVRKAKEDVVQVFKALKSYIDVNKLTTSEIFSQEAELIDPSTDEKISEISAVLGVKQMSPLFKRNVKRFYYYLRLRFQQKLPGKIIVSTKWPKLMRIDTIQIRTNFIEPMDMNNGTENILRTVHTREEKTRIAHEIFARPTYQPVKKGGKISLFHMYLTKEDGELVPFEDGKVVLILEFRRQRFR